MIRIPTTVFALALQQALAASWSPPAPIGTITKPYLLERPVNGGAFALTVDLTLSEIDGTAASIWFGDGFNFGFDGASGGFFLEGSAVPAGESRKLRGAAPDLVAGVPFAFSAVRDGAGVTAFAIDGETLLESAALKDRPLAIKLRPHRSTMVVGAVTLNGDLAPPPPPLTAREVVGPLIVDEANALFDLTLRLDRPRTLMGAVVEGSVEAFASIGPTASGALAAGTHEIAIVGTLRPRTGLLARPELRFRHLVFADGEMVAPTGAATFRPAYPIHRRGEAECHTTRIPGVAMANDGSLLAVYDLRYNSARDLQEHIDIGLSRSTDGGETWAPPRPIMDMGEYGGKPQKENGVSDPNILVDPATGTVFVAAVWTHGKPDTHQWQGTGSEPGFAIGTTAQFMVVRSDDHGVTWSAPENWTRRLKREDWWLFAPAPGNGIALADGTLVMPTQGRDSTGHPFSNITWSDDHGETWTVSEAARSNTTEGAVAQLADGALLLSMRDNRNRQDKSATNGRALAVTRDLGATWEIHPGDRSALPEPVCMASLISHATPEGQHVLLFSNPHDKHARKNITIQASLDGGHTWPEAHHLLLDGGTGRGYSSLVMIDGATVGILYESSRADLVFQKVRLAELVAR